MTGEREGIRLIPLYAKQRAAFYTPARLAVCEASTKAGKSVGALTWIIDHGVSIAPGQDHLWCAPIYPQAKIMYRRVRRWFTRFLPRHAWGSNDSELFIVLPNGGRLWFKGADNPDSIYGPDYAAAVMDEFTRAKEEAFFAVESTLTATGGPIRLIGNVKGRGNWGYRMARRAQSGEPGMAYSKITAYDAIAAGVLRPEVIEDKRRTLPENVFRELFLAEPSDDGGNPFGLQHIAACTVLHDVLSAGRGGGDDHLCPVAFGIDLARKQDWLVVHGLDAAGRTVVWDRWQHVPWEESYNRIAALIGDTPALVDSTGIGDVVLDRLQRKCGNVEGYHFSPTGKQHLMEGLAVAIQSRQVSFPDGPIRMELETFEYEVTRTHTRYSAPEGMHDDCVCALALAVQRRASFIPAAATMVGVPEPEVWETRRQRLNGQWDAGM